MGANASRPLVRLSGKSRENDNISLDTSPVPPAYIDDEIDGWMAIEADETTNLADAILPVPELDKAQLRLPNWTDILQSNQSLSTTTTNIDNTSNINDINNNNNENNDFTEKKRPSSGTISNKHNDWTTMVLCARYGYFESLQMFLSGNFGSIPSHDLWLALLLTCFLGHLSCLDLLLSQPEAISVLNKQTTDNFTPLLYALQQGHILCVERLLKEPTIDITLCDIYGWNALMYASRYGYTSIFSHILTLSPNSSINQQSKNDGWTALMLAIYGEHEQCAISLLHSDNINITISTYDGIWDALTLAIRLGQTETVQLLLTATSERSTTIPSEGSLTLSESLENNYNKININEIKNDRWTPLMLAARYGYLDCLQLLLTHHECEPDIVLHGYSALLLSHIFHHEQCVKLLLQYSKQSLDYIKTNGQPLTFSDGVVYQEQQQQKQQQQQQKQKEEEEEEKQSLQNQQLTNDVTDGNVAVIKDKNHDFNDNITYNDNIEPPHYNGD